MIKYTPYIIQYDNVLKPELIDQYRDTLSNFFDGVDCSMERSSVRDNSAWGLQEHSKDTEISKINDTIGRLHYFFMAKYLKDCPLMGKYLVFNKKIATNLIYRTYEDGDQYNWHIDFSEQTRFLVSVILYLNDDYDGGNTLFLNDKIKIKPKKNSILVFPCGPYFLHKSTPVKNGKKHIIWNCYQDSQLLFDGPNRYTNVSSIIHK